jgi:hypothetical protein
MTIHIFGDSHATTKFSGWKDCKNVISHHLGPVLCYSFGRDNLKKCNISNYEVKNNDTIIFCFGEIDCRCHIHKYIKNFNYKIIIEGIIKKYIEAININLKNCKIKFKNICIFNVIPPVKKDKTKEDPNYPFLGTDEERKQYINYFNQILKKSCEENNFIFFDIYDYYCDEEGFLKYELSYGKIHIKDGRYFQKFIDENNL